MQLTKKQIREYKKIHEKEFGVKITEEQAYIYASRLAHFGIVVLDKTYELDEITLSDE